jgi:hypothetical protein
MVGNRKMKQTVTAVTMKTPARLTQFLESRISGVKRLSNLLLGLSLWGFAGFIGN